MIKSRPDFVSLRSLKLACVAGIAQHFTGFNIGDDGAVMDMVGKLNSRA